MYECARFYVLFGNRGKALLFTPISCSRKIKIMKNNESKRQIFKETRITAHHDKKLKSVYLDIYNLLKSIKSNQPQIDSSIYKEIINSNSDYPMWLKRQMIKLVLRRINRINNQGILKKWFEFRLIVPRHRYKWIAGLTIPTGYFLRHVYFDSKNVFLTISKLGKNEKPRNFSAHQIESYELSAAL